MNPWETFVDKLTGPANRFAERIDADLNDSNAIQHYYTSANYTYSSFSFSTAALADLKELVTNPFKAELLKPLRFPSVDIEYGPGGIHSSGIYLRTDLGQLPKIGLSGQVLGDWK